MAKTIRYTIRYGPPPRLDRVVIDFIPHKRQRYPTVGDWLYRNGTLHIHVSKMHDPRYQQLVALHELVEVLLCSWRGILPKQVDDFDKAFEAKRKKGNVDEPGDDLKAPYRHEHFFATSLERLMAAELGVSWPAYDKTVANL